MHQVRCEGLDEGMKHPRQLCKCQGLRRVAALYTRRTLLVEKGVELWILELRALLHGGQCECEHLAFACWGLWVRRRDEGSSMSAGVGVTQRMQAIYPLPICRRHQRLKGGR